MCFRSADRVSAWTTWGILSSRGETIWEDFTDPKNDSYSDVARILSSRAIHFFFLSTNVFTIDGKLLRTRDESEQTARVWSSRFLFSNAKTNGSETARKIRCRALSRESYGTRFDAKPFGVICVQSMRIAELECVTAPNLLPLSVVLIKFA